MNRDHLLSDLSQARTLSDLDHLLGSDTLEGILNTWIFDCIDQNFSRRTIEHYQKKAGEFIAFVGRTKVPSFLNSQHVSLFLIHKRETCKPVSIHGYYRAIKRFFNWMVEKHILKESPMSGMKPPKVPKEIIIPYSQEQIKLMLDSCDPGTFLGSRNRALILMFISTGLRKLEMSEIQLKDVNINNRTIRVMGKGSKERIVGYGSHAAKAILIYVIQRKARVKDESPYLWLSEEGRRLTYWGIGQAIYDLRKSLGIEVHAVHGLRHTFATESLRNGARLSDIQSLMGHSTLEMSKKYAETVNSADAVKLHARFAPDDNIKGI